MSAILATVDIEDLATPKIAAIKDSLSDLGRVQQDYARSQSALAGAATQSANALGANAAQTQAAAAGFRTLGLSANALQAPLGSAVNKTQAFMVASLALGAALTLVGGGIGAYLKGAVDLSARVETLNVVVGQTAKNTHQSAFAMEVQVQAIRKLGITTREATETVLQFVQAELQIADASKLARVAQDLAVTAGINSSQALDRLLRAINTQQPELLRSFGILANMNQVMAKYAQTIGKTVKELDPLDRKQAILNFVLQEGEKSAGAYEASMSTASKQIGSMARLTEELAKSIGDQLLPIFTALVSVTFHLLEALNDLPGELYAIAAGVGVGAAAFLSLKGVLIAATPVLEAFGIALSATPIGWIALALGVATTAFALFSGSTEKSTDKLIEQAAKAQTNIDTLTRLKTAIKDLDAEQAKGVDKTQELQKAYADLKKVAPEAVELVNGQLRVHNDLLEHGIDLQKKSEEETWKEVDAKMEKLRHGREVLLLEQQEADAVVKRVRAQRDAVATAGDNPKYLTFLNDQLKKVTANADDAFKALAANKSEISKLEPMWLGLGAAFSEAVKRLQAFQNAQGMVTDAVAKFKKERVDAELQKVALSVAMVNDAAKDKTSLENLLKILTEMPKVTKKLAEEDDKAAKAAAAYAAALKSALDTMRGDSNRQRASLQAANTALGEVKKGTEEYEIRVLRAADAVKAFNLLTDAQKKKLPEVAAAAARLREVRLEESMREWKQAAEEANKAFEDFAAGSLEDLRRQAEDLARGLDAEVIKDRQDTLDRVYQMERDNYERTGLLRLSARDQAIYQEQKRVEDIERGILRERTARDAAFAEEQTQITQRFALLRLQAVREAQQHKERLTQIHVELMAKLDAMVRTRDITPEDRDAQLAAHRANISSAQAEVDIRLAGYQNQLNAEEKFQNAILQGRRESAAANDEIIDKAMVHTRAASAETIKRIIEQHQAWRAVAKEAFGAVLEVSLSTFARMLTGAESWKKGMVSIWTSLKNTFFGIVDSMVKKWVQGGLTQMFGGGPAGGKTGFGGLLQGLFKSGGLGSANPLAANSSTLAKLLSGIPGLTTTSLTGPTTSVIAGTGIPTTGATTLTALGTGAIAAGAGGLVGYNVGKLFKSRTKGALAGGLAGAGTGALIGATIGGPLAPLTATAGAIIGGIAGAIGGFFSGGKEAREVKKYRDELVAAQGGLEALKAKAKAAGFDLQKMMDTKKMKEFTAEAAKLDAVLRFGGMDELRKKAQLVGVDIDRIFAIKKAEDFNKEMEKLNGLLAAQEERLKGFQTAAAGLQNRAAGFQGAVTKDINTIYASLGTRTRETLQAAFVQAQKHGFSGTNLDFMVQKLKEVAEGGANIFNLPAGALAKYRKAVQAAQADFNKLGQYAAATFAGVLKETGDLNAAMEAVGPTLDLLIDTQDKLGLQTSDSLGKLLEFRKVLKVNQDVSQSLSGITQILDGLSKAGALTAEMFSTLGADATSQFDRLISRGVDADTAMLALQPTLQKLWEAQKKYGFAVDASTQSLIDQAVQQGLVGQQFQQTNEKILDVLLLIADALGATIPAALQNFQDSVDQTAPYAQDAFTGVALGNSPGGIREIVTQTNAAREALAAYRTQVANDSTAVSRDVMAAADSFKAFKFDPAALGGGSLGISGALGGMFGLGGNPNGTTRDVSSMLRDLHERRNTPVPQVELETAPVEGEFVAPTLNEGAGTASSEGISIHIQMGDINIDASALDGQDIERVFRTQIVPQLVQDLDRNTGQLANNIEQRIARYRRAT